MIEPFEGETPHEGDPTACNAARVGASPFSGQRAIRSCHLPACWRLGRRLVVQGTVNHLVLHMNTTPEGKMTALLDHIDQKISGDPAINGSFDGSRLILRFS